jgi:type IV pilus assembly protein PilE
MRNRGSLNAHRQRGVTLIELMIVVVVVGILAAIAYPSYQAQVLRAHRAEGKAELMRYAQSLEQCFTLHNRYDDAACTVLDAPQDSLPSGFYSIAIVNATLTRNFFALTATPQNAQTADVLCGVLGYNSMGAKTSLGAADDAAGCW